METGEEDMLYDGMSEPLTDTACTIWPVNEEDQMLSDACQHLPTEPPAMLSTVSGDLQSQWFEENLFTTAENPILQQLPISNDVTTATHLIQKERVISSIESVFESMLDVLLNKESSLTVFLKSRPCNASSADTSGRVMRFPGKTAEDAWRFTVLICILEIIHEAIATNRVISKREIYYRHPALFTNQIVVDRYVDDIAYTFDTCRSSLNVCAAAKGLVSGAVSITKDDNTVVHRLDDPAGHLVPIIDSEQTIQTTAKWILVIEKEAIFRSISGSTAWETLRHKGVIVTGKGYPDLSTRVFLHHLSAASAVGPSHVPVYALVDFDPDGLSIMCTYKYGSLSLAHEGPAAQVRDLQWLGVKSTQALPLGMASSGHQNDGLLQLSYRDRRKASGMLCNEHYTGDDFDDELKRELQVMLMLNLKAEIEFLESRDTGVAGWLMEQLAT